MILKGLAIGATVAAFAVAIFVALTFQPAGATFTPPTTNVVVLPNGIAAPQLQPVQQGAPALIEGNVSLTSLVRTNVDNAAVVALDLHNSMSKSAPLATNAVQYQALAGCGGK
ncbi:MAG: hypothetical protein AB4911_14300 [Oscillochloridaceae bacterium umkhey_bin13]